MHRDRLPDTDLHSRPAPQVVALALITVLAAYLCYRIALPFLPALTWATALAVLSHPLYAALRRRLRWPWLAVVLTIAVVVVAVALPAIVLARQAAREALDLSATLGSADAMWQAWQAQLARMPRLAQLADWIASAGNLQAQLQGLSEMLLGVAKRVLTGSAHLLIGGVIALYLLFYFLRDAELLLREIRALLPLSPRESARLLDAVRDTVYAIVYGTVAVSVLQGALGGLMFWWLGLPAPILWGAVMALLAILPLIGAAFVWVPAALFLALQGELDKALLLAAWGVIVVGLIDNLLYPVLVRHRMRLHTVLVFIAVVGGVVVFGGSGVVLGPVALAVMVALRDVWRQRGVSAQTDMPPHPAERRAASSSHTASPASTKPIR